MPYTLKLIAVLESYISSEGCYILGPQSKRIPAALQELLTTLPPEGLKRFVRCKTDILLLHAVLETWPDGVGATVKITTYGDKIRQTLLPIRDFHQSYSPNAGI